MFATRDSYTQRHIIRTLMKLPGTLAGMVLCLALLLAAPVCAAAPPFDTAAQYMVLMDSRSGKVFAEKNADELMQPASMSKIMTMLMVFERLRSGRLHMDDKFLITEDAWRRGGARSGGSTMYAEVNSRVALSDLIQGVIVQSANDACIAIAEGISGSEKAFAELMTKRARELGLTKTTFKNATGLPEDGHVTTARELGMLARYLIEVFPEEFKYYKEREFTWNNITQKNRNPLLGVYPGADGLKTGHTSEFWLWPHRHCHAGRPPADPHHQRPPERKGSFERGAKAAGLGVPPVPHRRTVCRRPDRWQRPGVGRHTLVRALGDAQQCRLHAVGCRARQRRS